MISYKEYLGLLLEADPDRNPIHKKRTCFLWKDRYYELDMFLEPHPQICLLELESDEDNDTAELPPWLTIEREVTDDPEYSNSAIARKK